MNDQASVAAEPVPEGIGPPATDTERALVALLLDAGITRVATEGARYRLLDDPTLDSFSRIGLHMEIESAFGLRLEPEELLDERCRSVAGLAALIDGRHEEGGEADA